MILNYGEELPIGFGLSLAMNEQAMQRFAGMTDSAKDAVVERSRGVSSRREMEKLVEDVAKGKWG